MERTVQYQNQSLFYRLNGQGFCVILLHGFGEDGNIWKNQISFLEKHFQLLVPDLPGSGQSQLIPDMSMEGLAESVRFLLQKEGITQCALIGHSMGGYITLAFAEKYPELLAGFGLFHSTAFADNEEKKNTRRKGIRLIQEKGAFEFLQNATPNLYSEPTKEKQPQIIEAHIGSLQDFSKDALIAYYTAMIERPDRTNVLKESKCPVLFVLGSYDMAVPLQDGLKQAHLPDFSYIHVLHQSGHMGMNEEPEKSNTLLLTYLSGLVNQYVVP